VVCQNYSAVERAKVVEFFPRSSESNNKFTSEFHHHGSHCLGLGLADAEP